MFSDIIVTLRPILKKKALFRNCCRMLHSKSGERYPRQFFKCTSVHRHFPSCCFSTKIRLRAVGCQEDKAETPELTCFITVMYTNYTKIILEFLTTKRDYYLQQFQTFLNLVIIGHISVRNFFESFLFLSQPIQQDQLLISEFLPICHSASQLLIAIIAPIPRCWPAFANILDLITGSIVQFRIRGVGSQNSRYQGNVTNFLLKFLPVKITYDVCQFRSLQP